MEEGGECRAERPRKQGMKGSGPAGVPAGSSGPDLGAANWPLGGRRLCPEEPCDLGEVTPPLEPRLPHLSSGDGRTLRVCFSEQHVDVHIL